MMLGRCFVILSLAAGATLVGCSSPVREETIHVQASNDPLHEPRQILERYAQGQPLGSEAVDFPNIVERVRKSDPKSAEVLDKGFQELQSSPPAAVPAKAKELLQKIQPMAYPAPESK